MADAVRLVRGGRHKTCRICLRIRPVLSNVYQRDYGIAQRRHDQPGNVTNNIQMAHLASSITPRQERNLIVAPVFHAAAALSMMAMVASGSTLVIHHEFVPARVVQSLDEEAITMTTMVPAMIQACLVAVPDIATRKFENYG